MISVCQYTGIEFESRGRSKNHPRVAALLAEANRKGVYGDVVSAMAEAKRAGITGEAVIELMFSLNAESGTTLVLVTHDTALAARCGRSLRLSAGRLVD